VIELFRVGAGDLRLAEFHRGVYLDAFADKLAARARDATLRLIAVGEAGRDDVTAFIDEVYTVCEHHTREAAFTAGPEKSRG
jgi:hypothetical protein